MLIKTVFDDFVRLNRGFDLPDSDIVPGDYPVVASTNIKAYHNAYKIEPPVVVTGRSGSLGKVQLIMQKCWPLNTALYSKDLHGNNAHYVYYYLQTMHLEQYNAGAGVPTLNQNHLQRLKIQIHPKEEQNRVAAILSVYDNLIEVNNKRIKVLEQMAENLYKEWFVRFRFPGHENAEFENGLPKGWKPCRFSSIANILSGGTPSTEHEEYYGGDIPFYTPKDSVDHVFAFDTTLKLTEEGLNHCNSKLYPKDTIMITARGTVGNLNLLAVPMAMNQSCYALSSDVVRSQYFLFYMIKREVLKLKKMASGGVFDTIIVNTFDHIKVLLPKDEVIEAFDKAVSPIIDQIYYMMEANQNLIKQRDLLLPRLMSGKLEV